MLKFKNETREDDWSKGSGVIFSAKMYFLGMLWLSGLKAAYNKSGDGVQSKGKKGSGYQNKGKKSPLLKTNKKRSNFFIQSEKLNL